MLIGQIIDLAHSRGLSQKDLAARAGIPQETLSRAKKRGSAGLDVVEALARAAGAHIGLVSGGPVPPPPAPNLFQDRYRWLSWANPKASNDIILRRALLNPEFEILLNAALEFGVNKVVREWESLKEEGDVEAIHAMPVTDRILKNICNGYQQATT